MTDDEDTEESGTWAIFKGPDSTTLDQAKTWLVEHMTDGAICPCCEQVTKLYKRKLTSSMGIVLILLAKEFRRNPDWIHVPSFINAAGLPPSVSASIRGDWAKMRWFGLIEEKSVRREDGSNRAGYWKVTESGLAFAENQVFLPKHVFLFNNTRYQFSKEYVRIVDVLGDKFNYAELMGG